MYIYIKKKKKKKKKFREIVSTCVDSLFIIADCLEFLTGPITIFCPTNEAFKAMMANKVEMVKGFNTTQFQQVSV